jgi:twitching motility protein PilU
MSFSQFFRLMAEHPGADLFLYPGAPPVLKLDGVIRRVSKDSLLPDHVRTLAYSIMNDKQRGEFEHNHECNFAVGAPGIGRFRVSVFMQRNSPAMVVRAINTTIPSLEALHLPPTLGELALLRRGLVVVAGEASSGRSTTVASMIDRRNKSCSGNIITIEDPIEYTHRHEKSLVAQREVGIDTGSHESALKSCLRQSPDVVFMGDIYSATTMKYALQFAKSGQLCIAILQAANVQQALQRMLGFFPADYQEQARMDLSLNLTAVVAQQLLPVKEGGGMRPAVEIMRSSPQVQEHIRTGAFHLVRDVMGHSVAQGMQTFDQALHALCKEGAVSQDVALAHASSATSLRMMLKQEGGTVASDQPAQPLSTEPLSAAPAADPSMRYVLEDEATAESA